MRDSFEFRRLEVWQPWSSGRLGHGCVEVGDELLDLGAQLFLGGEGAAAEEFSDQDGEPDFDLVEP